MDTNTKSTGKDKAECKIFYEADGVNAELDKALEETLSRFDYKRWASGYTFDTHIRDLAFEKEIIQSKNG